MKQNYRQLTEEEVKDFIRRYKGWGEGKTIDRSIKDYIFSYYPANAHAVIVSYNSEYNDQGYDAKVHYVAVYDVDQNELLPLKGKEREARDKWVDVFYIDDSNLNDPVEDKVYFLKEPKLPKLFVQIEN